MKFHKEGREVWEDIFWIFTWLTFLENFKLAGIGYVILSMALESIRLAYIYEVSMRFDRRLSCGTKGKMHS